MNNIEKMPLFKSMVLSLLLVNCCNALYLGPHLKSFWKLQLAKNTAVVFFNGLCWLEFIAFMNMPWE